MKKTRAKEDPIAITNQPATIEKEFRNWFFRG